jgi:hypothetical protein
MHQGKLVFAQLMLYLPLSTFHRCVADHNGEHKVKDFSHINHITLHLATLREHAPSAYFVD